MRIFLKVLLGFFVVLVLLAGAGFGFLFNATPRVLVKAALTIAVAVGCWHLLRFFEFCNCEN